MSGVDDPYCVVVPKSKRAFVARALGLTVPATVGAAVLIRATGGATSYAPASQPAPLGRAAERWSVGVHPAPVAAIASRTGLPTAGRRVNVGPPLSASAPRRGSTSAPGQLASPKLTLPPRSVRPGVQALMSLPAMMLLRSDALLPL